MVSRINTVAFEGIRARLVDVQCALSPGLPSFSIVGLPDKAVNEARERVRASLTALSIALPARKIVVNLSPASIPKEGSHFDLPIALALLAEIGALNKEEISNIVALGELALDGTLLPVAGALPAAFTAAQNSFSMICPEACAPEAAWVGDAQVFSARSLVSVIQHYSGHSRLPVAEPGKVKPPQNMKDLRDVKGQERAKRALEIAAAGRHHILLVGPPGTGKSMLASRLPSILPPMSPQEALETSMIQSVSGLIDRGEISQIRPFRAPHHTASIAAIVGGGRGAKPGEVSLAHNGVLFMDEFPEFNRQVLETLRQPLETGEVTISRANAHVSYPSRFLLIAAANPCKCGYLTDPNRACNRAPLCGETYMGRISGPLRDRFDLCIEMPPVQFHDLDLPANGERSASVAHRVQQARETQTHRYASIEDVDTNADIDGEVLAEFARPDSDGRAILSKASEKFGLSARGHHRVLRVARTIADLAQESDISAQHISEALMYRLVSHREIVDF